MADMLWQCLDIFQFSRFDEFYVRNIFFYLVGGRDPLLGASLFEFFHMAPAVHRPSTALKRGTCAGCTVTVHKSLAHSASPDFCGYLVVFTTGFSAGAFFILYLLLA